MLVEDNGTDIKVKEAQIAKAQVSGIGLSNMRERVEALGGTIAFLTDKGFEIRISVPKMSKTRARGKHWNENRRFCFSERENGIDRMGIEVHILQENKRCESRNESCNCGR